MLDYDICICQILINQSANPVSIINVIALQLESN